MQRDSRETGRARDLLVIRCRDQFLANALCQKAVADDVGLLGDAARAHEYFIDIAVREQLGDVVSGRDAAQPEIDCPSKCRSIERSELMGDDIEPRPSAKPRQINVCADDHGDIACCESREPATPQRAWHSVDLIAIDHAVALVSSRRLQPPSSVRPTWNVVIWARNSRPPVVELRGFAETTVADDLHERPRPRRRWIGDSSGHECCACWRSERGGGEWVSFQADRLVSIAKRHVRHLAASSSAGADAHTHPCHRSGRQARVQTIVDRRRT